MNMFDAGATATQDSDLESLTENLRLKVESLQAVRGSIGALRERAESRDRLVRVEVDASGAVVDVQLALDAFGQATPTELAASIVEASSRAATRVRQRGTELLGEARAGLPDLPDIVPGAPSVQTVPADEVPVRVPRHSAEPQSASILREANHG